MTRDGSLGLGPVGDPLQRVLWGMGLGIPIGAVLALAAGLTRIGDDAVDANVQMLRFVPIIGLQPLLILWLGIGETAKISLIVLGVAFPIYVNAYAAIRVADPGISRALHGGRAQSGPVDPPDRAARCAAGFPGRPADGDPVSPGCCSCSPSRSTRTAASATS